MKKKKIQIDKKELIITIVVLVIAIVIGFTIGKVLFDSLYGNM